WRTAGFKNGELHRPLPCHCGGHRPMLKAMDDNWLEGRHALITGGGTGIGAAAAAHLHAAGAKVSLLGRRLEPLEQVANIVEGKAIACDVTDRDAISRAFD